MVVLEDGDGPIWMRTDVDVVEVDDVDVLDVVLDVASGGATADSVVDVVSFGTVDVGGGGDLLSPSLAEAAQMSPARKARTPATAAAIAVARPVMASPDDRQRLRPSVGGDAVERRAQIRRRHDEVCENPDARPAADRARRDLPPLLFAQRLLRLCLQA